MARGEESVLPKSTDFEISLGFSIPAPQHLAGGARQSSEFLKEWLPWANKQLPHRDCLDNIGATDNSDDVALAHHRHTFDMAPGQQSSNLINRSIFLYRGELARHNFSNNRVIAVTIFENICLGNHSNKLTVVINDRNATDPLVVQQSHDFLDASLGRGRIHLTGHQ